MQAAFEQKCLGLHHRPYLLFLGRIHPKKGVDILIKAYAAVYGSDFESHKPAPCLVIAGPGMETTFGGRCSNWRLEPVLLVRFFGRGCCLAPTNGALSTAQRAFVLFSHQENFGIAVAEALSCGTPVLISNQINIWREIEEDRAGYVGDDSVDGSETLLRRWKSRSPQDHLEMKHAAQFSFESRFGIGFAAQNLVAFLEESVKRPRAQKAIFGRWDQHFV